MWLGVMLEPGPGHAAALLTWPAAIGSYAGLRPACWFSRPCRAFKGWQGSWGCWSRVKGVSVRTIPSGSGLEGWIAPILIAVLSGLVVTASFAPTGSKTPNTTAASIVQERPGDHEPINARAWEDPLLAVSEIKDERGLPASPGKATDCGEEGGAIGERVLEVEIASLEHLWMRVPSGVREESPSPDHLRILIQEMMAGQALRMRNRVGRSDWRSARGWNARVSSPLRRL